MLCTILSIHALEMLSKRHKCNEKTNDNISDNGTSLEENGGDKRSKSRSFPRELSRHSRRSRSVSGGERLNSETSADEFEIDYEPTSSYVTFNNMVDKIKYYLMIVYNATIIYFIWIFIHYISIYLYQRFCTPYTIIGILLSPLLISSPHCKALRWAIYTGANTLDSMWALFGIWISSKLITRRE